MKDELSRLQALAEQAALDARLAQRAARKAKLRANIFEKMCKFGSYTVIAHRGFGSLAHLVSSDPERKPWREGHEFFCFAPSGTENALAEAERAAEMIVAMGERDR